MPLFNLAMQLVKSAAFISIFIVLISGAPCFRANLICCGRLAAGVWGLLRAQDRSAAGFLIFRVWGS